MKSKFVRRPSSVRPSVRVIFEPNAQISFKFWLLHPLDHTLRLFLFFEKKKLIFTNMFRFCEHGTLWEPKFQKHYSSYKSQPKVFKLFLSFLPNGPQKSTILNFLNFEFMTFFFVFVNMGPYGNKTFKTLLLSQIMYPMQP